MYDVRRTTWRAIIFVPRFRFDFYSGRWPSWENNWISVNWQQTKCLLLVLGCNRLTLYALVPPPPRRAVTDRREWLWTRPGRFVYQWRGDLSPRSAYHPCTGRIYDRILRVCMQLDRQTENTRPPTLMLATPLWSSATSLPRGLVSQRFGSGASCACGGGGVAIDLC